MPAHIIKRADCGGMYYLVDGDVIKSLKTKTKRYAEALLRQRQDGKYGLKPVETVGAYYERWIGRKIEPLVRRAQIRDYKQHFDCYLLPKFKDVSLLEIRTGDLANFQVELLRKVKVKTARNIIDASFRAMYRDARAEIDELAGKDPFMDVRWPKVHHEPPHPFIAEEQEKIVAAFGERKPFFYPSAVFNSKPACGRASQRGSLGWTWTRQHPP